MIDIFSIRRAHIVGVGGIGISAIARMLRSRGVAVSGSDMSEGHTTQLLREEGIEVFIGHDATHIPDGCDVIIYSPAIPATNPELIRAQEKGIVCITYPQALASISKKLKTIAVAGAHGKTTTTAMLAEVLIRANMSPTVIVGSYLSSAKSNFVSGTGEYFIVEACEYKRSFLNLTPTIAVITNIDDDHLDYYGSREGIEQGFYEFCMNIVQGGTIVTDIRHERIVPVLNRIRADRPDIVLVDYAEEGVLSDTTITVGVPGIHNRKNAAAVFAAAKRVGVTDDVAQGAIASFAGTWRRFEYKGSFSGIDVYDDYAHHPTELRATLQACREKNAMSKDGDTSRQKAVCIIFQPHLFSRTKEHFDSFVEALSEADIVIMPPIYPAREAFDPSITSGMLIESLKNRGVKAIDVPDLHGATEAVLGLIGAGDLVVGDMVMTIGAGDVYQVADELLAVR